ncbi:MAG: winged helix-turn-helix transcriptional regulator [Candidatus Methanoperedens sp.]|nr:winged helix-turn-helix transcriptional regulator [Candidatus Methanoperedens sp.]
MATTRYEEIQRKALELEIRQSIYSLISASPGLHFREIQRRTKIATGQLTYHLNYLQKAGLIKTINDGEYLRYYAYIQINEEERKVLELVRQKSIRHILLYLLENNNCNHEHLVKSLHISPSTISWHLKKLIDASIVNKKVEGRRSFYSINNPELVKKILIKYKESFLDILVDRFIEMWET